MPCPGVGLRSTQCLVLAFVLVSTSSETANTLTSHWRVSRQEIGKPEYAQHNHHSMAQEPRS